MSNTLVGGVDVDVIVATRGARCGGVSRGGGREKKVVDAEDATEEEEDETTPVWSPPLTMPPSPPLQMFDGDA